MEKENKTHVTLAVSNSPAFGRRIRRLREARGISMVELSRATGINYTSISAFELGRKGTISAEKAGMLYDFLSTLPEVKTPLVTGPGRYPKKRKQRKNSKASAVKQTAATPVKETPASPSATAPDPEPTPEPTPEPVAPVEKKERKIRNLNDLIHEVNIRAFRECLHLIEEIDDERTPAVVRSINAQQLVTLTNFLKENRGSER